MPWQVVLRLVVCFGCVCHTGGEGHDSTVEHSTPQACAANGPGSDVACGAAGGQSAVAGLLSWLNAHGAWGLSNITVRDFVRGNVSIRGVAASYAVEVTPTEKQEIFRIPAKVLMTVEHESCSKWKRLQGQVLHLPMQLAVCLAAERRKVDDGSASFWSTYIQTLPTLQEVASFHPLYAETSLRQFFSSWLPLAGQIEQDQLEIEKVWARGREEVAALAAVEGTRGPTFEDFQWAVVMIKSRGFWASWSSGGIAMVPVMDLLNTGLQSEVNTDWTGSLEGSPAAWVVTASRSVVAGAELLDSYGTYSNDDWLRYYGFMLESNPRQVKPIEASACEEDSVSPTFKVSQPAILASLQALLREHCATKRCVPDYSNLHDDCEVE